MLWHLHPRLLFAPACPDLTEAVFEVPGKAPSVGERRIKHSATQAAPQFSQVLEISGERARYIHVVVDRICHHARQADIREHAHADPRDVAFPGQGNYWHTHPERMACGCTAVERKRIERNVGL